MARRRMPSHVVLAKTTPKKRTGLKPVAVRSPNEGAGSVKRPLAPGKRDKSTFGV